MSPAKATWSRTFIPILSLGWLVIAIINVSIAVCAKTERDRARADYANILGDDFQSTQDTIFQATLFATSVAVPLAIFGFVIALRRELSQQKYVLIYVGSHMLVAIVLLGIGLYLPANVYGYRTSFEKFGGNAGFLHYGLEYYGGIAVAVYSGVSVIVVVSLILLTGE